MIQAVILLGAPGAGKGTLAEGLKRSADFIHVSTGDMLREQVKAGRPLGLRAKAYMDQGELVPDDLIMQIIAERLDGGPAAARYLFDGFPRTTEQARGLDALLAARHGGIRKVFLLEASRATLVARLAGRRVCQQCAAVYHLRNIPPRQADVCDQCGGPLRQRPDDTEATVLNRLEVFRQQTEGLIAYYAARGLLARIDAGQQRDQALADIINLLPVATPP
ncbi:MAG: adenylate kinase [Kiritimatiellaeota bacterium]|nr:adenylate kinase [Kiritimatiellota bacterium]